MASVGSIIGGGFGLIRDRPVAVAIWFVVQFVVALATQLMLIRMMNAQIDTLGVPDPSALGFIGIGMSLLAGLVTLALLNASYRAVLRPSESAFGYLRLGMDELRIFGLFLILVIVGGIGAFILVLLLGFVAAGFAAAFSGSPGMAMGVVVLLYLALVAGLVFLWVRLSLVLPLTLLRRKIVIDGSWELTSGRFWTLFAAYLVIWLVSIVIYAAFTLPFVGPYFSELMQAMGNPEALKQVEEAQALRTISMSTPMMVLMVLLSALAQTITMALSSGASATAARELLYERGEVTEDDVQRTAEIFE
ncbi:hypothetical protein P1X14_13785 [Sphingomonas sp. AOB5]|uniref:hypothetical protein n=1 Tax=Sphingomonas sp. AOB5 TaxID=3034017 RepID=UPI0023F9D9A1|nr:hypothetical protein [Sphingomonas sp. AOB5]MDF7776321.1 hypothetical protein [Sphingomonas sp. AOB5]